MTGYAAYWIGRMARRFNEEGAAGLVAQRKAPPWGASRPHPRTLLPTAQNREELRTVRVGPAPQDDGWNSRTVATWLSARVGHGVSQEAALHELHVLDFTPPAPRPRHCQAASPAARTGGNNSWKPR